jgi:AraC family transcriptional regulator
VEFDKGARRANGITGSGICLGSNPIKYRGDDMDNILVNDTNPETKDLLLKCLWTARFEFLSMERGFAGAQVEHEKFPTATDSTKLNAPQSIFPSIPRLRAVFSFIELNYHQNIGLKEVAQAVDYSPAYLTDLVRRMTGKTVNTWIIERRIKEASILLLETNYSIQDIALKLGYQNISYFHRQFREYYQSTPRTWRENKRCHVV